MGYSKAQKAANHELILDHAAAAFRKSGIQGIGVADLMKEVGLTHGGFYAHFASRDHLVAEAIDRAFDDAGQRLRANMKTVRGKPLSRFLKSYLSEEHRDRPEEGCPVAALAGDAARSGPEAKTVFTQRFERYVDWIGSMLDKDPKEVRQQALAIICALAGAVTISRALDDASLSGQVLEAVKTFCEEKGQP